MNALSPHAHHSDYKRGKRNKKLQAMLNSKKAQSILLRFQRHSFVVTLLLLCAHIGCFVGIDIVLTSQIDYVTELESVRFRVV